MTYLSDEYLFPALQLFLLLLCMWAFIKERLMLRGRSSGGFKASVTRGEHSMATFYGAYGVISAVLVALALEVEWANDHRTAVVFFNAAVPAYLCLVNGWFRNKALSFAIALMNREQIK